MESGTAWPAALGDTLGRCVTPLLWPGLKPLNAFVAGAGDDVHEVALEVSRILSSIGFTSALPMVGLFAGLSRRSEQTVIGSTTLQWPRKCSVNLSNG